MKMWFVSRFQNNRGSALISTVIISMVVLILSSGVTNLILSWNKRSVDGSDRLALEIATRSSFLIMEAALKRRLWEVPLGTDCMKKSDFSAKLNPLDDMVIEVKASKQDTTGVIVMEATGSFRGVDVAFRKIIKISDASEFLLFSKGKSQIRMDKTWGVEAPTGLIAGPKRVYVEGPLVFNSATSRSTTADSWVSPPPMEKKELGIVLQGDRLLLAGGLSYALRTIVEPNPSVLSSKPEYDMFQHALLTPYTTLKGKGAGSALVFSDYGTAKALYDGLEAKTYSSLPPVSFYQKNIYPQSLFCGSAPLVSAGAMDSGCYINDINSSYSMRYTWHEALYGTVVDASCLTTPGDKHCTSSTDFPNGFNAWRSHAGLDNTVFTEAEVETIDFPPIGWDNLIALEEEAAVCGLVISAPESGAVEDCDIADQKFLEQHYSSGGVSSCEKMSEVDMENLGGRISNLNLAAYSNPKLENRYGRRVIYSKVPLSIAQSSAKGLWPGLVNSTARENIPIWFVNEAHFRLKPYQFDTSSPLADSPATMRELHFNAADPGVGSPLKALKLVMISPESIEVVSPGHIPYSFTDFQNMYPNVSGKVVPRQWSVTDYQHQEDDGYKFGLRKVLINNMIVVSNSGPIFNLRGLWSTLDSSAAKYLANGCMFDAPASIDPGPYATAQEQPVPSYASLANPMIPPAASRFYVPENIAAGTPAKVGHFALPNIFMHQYGLFGHESSIVFKGARLNVGFENRTYLGNNLSKPKRKPLARTSFSSKQVNISDRSYTYNKSSYFDPTGATARPCAESSMLQKGTLSPMPFRIWVNDGRHTFSHESAEDNLSNVGAVLAQPMMSTREK